MAEIYKNGDRVKFPDGTPHILQDGQWVEIEVGKLSSAGIGLFDKGVENVGATLDIAGDAFDAVTTGLGAATGATVGSAANLIQGQPANFGQQFAESRERLQNTPASQLARNLPRTPPGLGENIRAGVRSLGPSTLTEAFKIEQERGQQAEELFPFSHGVGQFGADAAALLALRKGSGATGARSRAAQRNIENAEEFLQGFRRTKRQLDPKIQSQLDDVATKTAKNIEGGVKNLKSLGIKVGEATLEGAYLAALNNEDPFVSGAVSAGTQAAGSFGLFVSEKARRALLPTLASAFAIHELWKTFAPGDQNFFESKDFAFQTTGAALFVGVLGGLVGSGRLGASSAKNPFFADLATALPRAGAENIFRQLRDNSKEGNLVPEQVLERLGSDPEFFNANQINSLTRAMNSKREGAFTKEIDRLMRDSPSFQERIALLQQQRTPPSESERIRTGIPRRDLELGTPTQPIQRN